MPPTSPTGYSLHRRGFGALTLSTLLSACALRPGPEALIPVEAPPVARQVTVLVATTRQRKEPEENVFTAHRALAMNYAEFTVSIPPTHVVGEIEYPTPARDPKTSFVITGQRLLDRQSFLVRLRDVKARRGRDAGVFVHGFNTNFQESLFRLAQMAADSDIEGVPVLFAWPSRASITGYIADRESVAYSRDYLAELLTTLADQADGGRVRVFAHSMGAWLTVETLRQLRLAGRNAVIDKLNVVLAAPDIDIDVFRTEIAVIGPMKPPLTVLVSKDDTALSLSSFISNERPRVGAVDISNPLVQAAARKADVRLIDISAVQSVDAFNHDRFARLVALYPRLRQSDTAVSGGTFVFDALSQTITAPFTIASQVLNQ